MKLTREEAIRLHRELWKWLAENPMKEKSDWPGWERYSHSSNCFLCDYDHAQGGESCTSCPVEFIPNKHNPGSIRYCLGGLFDQWRKARQPEDRSRLAALIRDLPEKTEKKEPKPTPKYKPGDKVIAVSKTVPFYESPKKFLPKKPIFVSGISEYESNRHGQVVYNCEGNYYFESDLTPYVEPGKKTKALNDFHIGDRVIVLEGGKLKGKLATVKSLSSPAFGCVGVAFDTKIGEHGLKGSGDGGRCEDGYGMWLSPERLELYTEPAPEKKPEVAFKVGDRVRVCKSEGLYNANLIGKTGTIKSIDPPAPPACAIVFDEPVVGGWILDNCGEGKALCKDGYGFWVAPCFLEPLPSLNHCPAPKTITREHPTGTATYIFNGPATVCVLEANGQKLKGVAKCHPSDKWDEAIGMTLAFERAVKQLPQPRLIPVLKRVKATAEHMALVHEEGFYMGLVKGAKSEEEHHLLFDILRKPWSNKVRKALNTDRGLTFNRKTMEFILFDVPASELKFGNRIVRKDGELFLEMTK